MHLGILTSHPIQYQAPWFRALAKEVDLDLEVFFAHRQSAAEQGKAGFGIAFEWDVDLLFGYQHRFLNNVSRNPGVNHFAGCDTPEIADIISGKLKSGNLKAEIQTASGKQKPGGAVSDFSFQLSTFSVSPFDSFIVTGWYLKSHLQAVRACRATGVPVLVRGDSQLRTPRSALKRIAMEVRQRWLLRQFDGFLSVGKRHQEYLEHYGVPPQKIFHAPHFVDNEWFAAKAAEVRSRPCDLPSSIFHLRKTWGADEQTLVALFVGKFIAKKKPGDLLRALGRISPAGRADLPVGQDAQQRVPTIAGRADLPVGQNAQQRVPTIAGRADLPVGQDAQQRVPTMLAVFVGSGELEQHLRAEAERLGVAAKFVGFKNQTELPACYVAADVLVLPSESETWGLAVNEAMACGLPAIVSDAVGCGPDLIEDGLTGFTFPVGDVAALADRLAVVAEMKRRGHDFAPALAEKMKAYSLEAAVRGTIQAAEKLKTENRS